MASHGPHPDIFEHGLADGCERCDEIALDPFKWFDRHNLKALLERTRMYQATGVRPRSENEHIAIRQMEIALFRCQMLDGLEE